MTPGVSRARGPIDGHIVEQFEIRSDYGTFPAGDPTFWDANDESIRILAAQVGTCRIEQWMSLVRDSCGLPLVFARRRPFEVMQPF
jgi:hypothetical protein